MEAYSHRLLITSYVTLRVILNTERPLRLNEVWDGADMILKQEDIYM